MTSISEFRRALAAVPSVLLSSDDQRVLTDARTSLDVLERIDVVPRCIAFVGASGSGKSTLANATAGADIAAVGVVRPTTTRVTMYGSSGPVSLSARSDYVHVPGMRPGLVIIDTPPWEHDPEGVRSVMAVADVVGVVVTPSRYSDASIHDLLAELPGGRPSPVVLNRVAVHGSDRTALVESVRSRYGDDVVEVDEAGDTREVASRLIDMLPVDTDAYERAAILRSAAAAAGRYVARVTAGVSADVGAVARAIDAVTPYSVPTTHTVVEEWTTTRTELVREVEAARRALDDDIVRIADSELATRLRSTLPEVEPGRIAVELDHWRSRCVAGFRAAARIRWRRSAADAILDRYSWKLALNPSVQVPPRMRRIMGSRLDPACLDAAADLSDVLGSAATERRDEWRVAADALGAYAPGALLGVADGFSPPPT